MFWGIETQTVAGPTISFRCPACGAEDSLATTYEYAERVLLFHLVPVSPYRRISYVKCSQCSEVFRSEIGVFELPQWPSHQLPQLLRRQVPLVPAFLAICGILLFPFPILGLLINGISFGLNRRRSRHWTRTVALVGLVLTLVIHLAFMIMLLIEFTVGQ